MKKARADEKLSGEAASSLRDCVMALFNRRGRVKPEDTERLGKNVRRGFERPDDALGAVIEIAIESWRFGRIFERTAAKLMKIERERCMNQLSSFNKKIENSLAALGLRMVNIEGTPFDPGMAATPLNIEDFKADDELVVDRMIEPIIMGRDGLVKTGRVTLRKLER
ncbi:MAG: hypothetical protein LBK91_06195 [Synergistaceae bacterium]|jgi:hypothetical protein|nr:hypothetical protein [Synergistaceae bacterium]